MPFALAFEDSYCIFLQQKGVFKSNQTYEEKEAYEK